MQDGCNQFCTYCIIPYARGRVRSRRTEHILKEVRELAEKGYKEIVLTGIHLSSYGMDFKGEEDLLSLIQEVHKVEGIRRIRLGSLEPGIITEKFVQGISALEKVCPHFHLSLQSGCDRTLERMNRRYRSAEYAKKCALIRMYYENPALTTDVIVGFPMETEEDFRESYQFVEGIRFYETHIFKYSRRQGTKAAAMDGQIPEKIKGERSEQLLLLNEKRSREYEEALIGKKLDILLEEKLLVNGKEYFVGHSREYVKAAVETGTGYQVNDIVSVRADGFLDAHLLHGTPVLD